MTVLEELHTLTGRRRHRLEPRLFRKPLLVLQVEVNVKATDLGPWLTEKQIEYNMWRDATTADLKAVQHFDTTFLHTDNRKDGQKP